MTIVKTVKAWDHASVRLRTCGVVVGVLVCPLLLFHPIVSSPQKRTELVINDTGVQIAPRPSLRRNSRRNAVLLIAPVRRPNLRLQGPRRLGFSSCGNSGFGRGDLLLDQSEAACSFSHG